MLPQLFKDVWHKHGTKLLGFGTTALGVITYVDKETVNMLQDVIGVHGVHYVLVASGLATAWRGFTNSKKAQVTNE